MAVVDGTQGTGAAGTPAVAPLGIEASLLEIPTLGSWGLLLLAAALAAAAVVRIRRG